MLTFTKRSIPILSTFLMSPQDFKKLFSTYTRTKLKEDERWAEISDRVDQDQKIAKPMHFVVLDMYVLKIKKENKQKFGNFCSESPFLKTFQTQLKSWKN